MFDENDIENLETMLQWCNDNQAYDEAETLEKCLEIARNEVYDN